MGNSALRLGAYALVAFVSVAAMKMLFLRVPVQTLNKVGAFV